MSAAVPAVRRSLPLLLRQPLLPLLASNKKSATHVMGALPSLRQIAEALTNAGHRPRRSETWHIEVIATLLRRLDQVRAA